MRAPLETVPRRWFDPDHTCVVAATGPSLTEEVAAQCRAVDVIAVNDAWMRMPWAVALYAADRRWWMVHHGVPAYQGEKWTAHGKHRGNDKLEIAARYGLRLVAGADGPLFSTDPASLTFGHNSLCQAIGLAIHFGARRIVLVGADMRIVEGKRHFFGDHPSPLHNERTYRSFRPWFHAAAKRLPAGVRIINATPRSALTAFPAMDLASALRGPAHHTMPQDAYA